MTAWRKSTYSTGAGGTTDCVEVVRLAVDGGEQGREKALLMLSSESD